MRLSMRYLVALVLISLSLVQWLGASELKTEALQALKPRSIGPAAMSGRVTAFAVDPRNDSVIYTGTASGGLWRSENGGITWEPVFEKEGSSSIGAVQISPVNPDVIWVGTGEGNPRNSQSVGDGIYRSLDRGRTWSHMGLARTEHIHRILIHPQNPDVVYAGAVGPTWSDGEERGVFKTTDGGRSWRKVLYVNEKTGVADLVMDPVNPDKLIVAMWEHRRWPWFFKSGGPGSGLYVTYDGGETWVQRTAQDGLPEGELGRSGLAIAPSSPDIVYALIESKKNALFRSDDGGHTWNKVNDKPEIGNRPFYYFDIFVDPGNENRLYSLHSSVTESEDGGRSFQTLVSFSSVHSDHHAFWINPSNPNHLLLGNDGGMSISGDRGKTWRFVENLPVGQFYHINVDQETPYNVYGGLQDNGSYMGPSQVWEGGVMGLGAHILNSHWKMVSFGDGFDVVPDPSDNRYGYSMSQGGNLYRYDRLTGSARSIRPADPDSTRLRFNWNAGIAVDPFDPRTVYYGSQFVHRSRDRGESWEIISEDLTSNDPEKQRQLDSGGLTFDVTNAENHTTIVALALSPKAPGVIWVGTDDGNVQLTRDGGRTWKDVAPNIAGLPPNTWVPHIEPSKFNAASAFVVFDDHRRGNWTPYLFRTDDFGETWTNLITSEIRGFVYVVEQDPVVESLLFLGTEFHLYFSLDAGGSWVRWDQGYPTVPTRDLVVHPREGDLVIGTFGRAIYIVDDITPLRILASEGTGVLESPLRLLTPVPAVLAEYGNQPGEIVAGDGTFKGENRPKGAILSYFLNSPKESAEKAGQEAPHDLEKSETAEAQPKKNKVKIEILQGENVIRTLEGPAENGLNRAVWELDRKSFRLPTPFESGPPAEGEPGGYPVLPGAYTVRIQHQGQESSQQVTVRLDPRLEIPDAALEARRQLMDRFLGLGDRAVRLLERLDKSRDQIDRVGKLAKEGDETKRKDLENLIDKTRESLQKVRSRFIAEPVQGIRMDPDLLVSRFYMAGSYVRSTLGAPSPTELRAVGALETSLNSFAASVEEFFAIDWESFREAVRDANLSLVN